MIKIDGLSHSLGGKTVLKNVCLEVKKGSILGVIGINGAGKSTLLRLMCGVYVPDEGSVAYDGESPLDHSVRQGIFFLPDDPYYTHGATCKSIVQMYKAFYPDMDMQVYKAFMEKCGLDERKYLRSFSKGMRRQFYIAVALAVKPKYLLLDEAFDGLDPLARKYFKDSIIEYAESENTTVVITSHSLRELEAFCDGFVLIDGKTVASCGDIAEKTDGMCKYQLAFTQQVMSDIFNGLPVISVNTNGKFVQIVLACNAEQGAKMLCGLPVKPAVTEEMEMNFEEMFISEVSRRKDND